MSTSTSSFSSISSSSRAAQLDDEDDEEEEEDEYALTTSQASIIDWLFQADVSVAQYIMSMQKERIQCNIYVRRDITAFLLSRANDPLHHRRTRMSYPSFVKLVDLLRDQLVVDVAQGDRRGGATTPEVCVYCTLRYLAGSSYICISDFAGIAPATFYIVLQRTFAAIMKCNALSLHFPTTVAECEVLAAEFGDISFERAIENCVGCLDGFVLPIKTPNAAEVGNVKAYFSGQYQRMAINAQAVVDSHCRFLHFTLCAPGSAHDSVAVNRQDEFGVSVSDKVEAIPPNSPCS
jgi:DDE superfamily endonuclease